ncbi:MAG: MFS transporter [Chloroflexi bacterium]|nr:MFS transporter [Chloroflexota bacterium]
MLERLGFTALTYGPFRAFFAANLLTNASWFVYSAAFGWLVLEISGSPATVGFAAFISGLPFLLLTLYAGLLTDRFGARPLVAISFALTGSLMFILGVVALVPNTPLALVILLAFFSGITQTIGGPGYIAIVSDLVPPRSVSSGVAMTFLGFNLGRITGGVLGGVLVAIWPAGIALIVAAMLQGLPSLAVWRIRTPPREPRPDSSRAILGPLVEAARYGLTSPTLAVLILMSAVPGLGIAYQFLMPVAATEFAIGGEGLGLLLGATGLGGLAAGLIGESVMRRFGHGRTVFIGLATAATGMLAFGLAPVPAVAIASMSLVGGGFLLYGAASLSLIQALSPARLRGRLTSVFTLLYWGLMPVGGMLGGALAEVTSARFTMGAAGVGIATVAVLAMLVRRQILGLHIGSDGISADLVPEKTPEPELAA